MTPGYPARPTDLPPRLAAVAARLGPAAPVADVGTDHGHLALHLAARSPGRRVFALDRSPRALAVARGKLQALGAGELTVALHLSEGLAALAPGSVAEVAIAGMGGHTVARILEEARDHLPHLQRLVLQPNDHVPALRGALHALRLALVAETVVWERGRPYAILVAQGPPRADLPAPTAAELLVGPLLAAAPEAGVDRWLAREAARLEGVLAAARSGGGSAPDEVTELLSAVRATQAARSG